jgi:hypothetical protein
MFRNDDIFRRGVDNSMGAFLQRSFELDSISRSFLGYRTAYEWNDLCRFSDESVCKLLIEGDKVSNIDVAIVLFQENILADLVSAKYVNYCYSSHGLNYL